MKRILFTISFLLTVFGRPAYAQRHSNAVGISVGTLTLRMLDQQASPLRYRGTIRPVFGLRYGHASDRSRFNLRLSGGAGSMNPERFGSRSYATPFPDGKTFTYDVSSVFYSATIEADYLRRVNSPDNATGNLWVGGALQESMWYADEVANFPWVMNTATVAPVVQYDYPFQPRHTLTLRVDLAVFGLITRAIYANFPKSTDDTNVGAYFKQGTRTATINKLGNVNVQLGYGFRVNSRISLGAFYRVRYLSYPLPRPIRAVSSTLSLESEVRF
ncbi:hypothetical protein [Larkinella arboricola]